MKRLRTLFDAKLWKFLLVGVINTLVGTGIMFGLYNLSNCSYWVSSAANYVLTSILSFFLNKHFTFLEFGGGGAGKCNHKQLFVFYVFKQKKRCQFVN